MKERHILCLAAVLVLGLGLMLALLWVLDDLSPARAAPTGITRYVALTGDDSGSVCASPITPCRTVQHAVNVADWFANDQILVATGIYTGTSPQALFIQKTITIRGGYTTTDSFANPPDPDANPTTLDGRGQMRVVVISGGVTPTLEGLRLTNGWEPVGGGGGIRAAGGAHPVISGCRIFSNTASSGSGVFLDLTYNTILTGNEIYSNTAPREGGGVRIRSGGSAVLAGNRIHDNTSYGNGGGVYASSNDVTLTNNDIFDNIADGAGGIDLISSDDATLTGNRVYNNTAQDGTCGGICLSYSDNAHLTGNEVFSNTTTSCGGGVYLGWSENGLLTGNKVYSNTADICAGGIYLDASHHAALTANRIYRNAAESGNGGGVHLKSSHSVTLTNNIVADNQIADTNKGAGISVYDSDICLLHTTIARNGGGEGQGVYAVQATGTGVVTLTNTILVSHTIGIQTYNGAVATLTATLWGDGTWANITDTVGSDISIGTVNVQGDPLFVDPDRGDYHIGAGSAAFDQGVDAGVQADIDGETRPFGVKPDLGADELPAVLAINKVGPATALAGAPITFTLLVTNSGAGSATGVVVTDALPIGAHYVNGGTLMPGGLVSWTVPSLAGNDSAQVQFVVTATRAITNSDYGVSCAEGVSAIGAETTVTRVEHKIYLPLVLRGP